jgi:hypothetical protein
MRIATFAGAMALVSGRTAAPYTVQAAVIVGVAPPAARVEVVPAPRVNYVWAPGYWRWNGPSLLLGSRLLGAGAAWLPLGAIALGRVRAALALCARLLGALSRRGLGPPQFLFSRKQKTVGQGPPYEGFAVDPARCGGRRNPATHQKKRPAWGAGRWGRDGASGERRGESRHRAARIRATTLHKPDVCVRVICKRVKIRVVQ